jgi:GNAT superfamily N-acetyltransferase
MNSVADIKAGYVDEDSEFEHVYNIRCAVFQRELGMSEDSDMDGHEHISHHYLAWYDGIPVGAGRWRLTMAGKAKIERVAVLPEFRRLGVGSKLMELILNHVPEGREVVLESPPVAVPFFSKQGFVERPNEMPSNQVIMIWNA